MSAAIGGMHESLDVVPRPTANRVAFAVAHGRGTARAPRIPEIRTSTPATLEIANLGRART